MFFLHFVIVPFVFLSCGVNGGSYYFRWAQQKLAPSAASGLPNLSAYVLSTLSAINEPSVCASQCNLVPSCQSAQHQASTKTCTLFSITGTGSVVMALVNDSDYTTFSINSVTLMAKGGQVVSQTSSIYYNQILSTINSISCTNPVELGVMTEYLEDLAFSSSSASGAATGGAVYREPPCQARLNNPGSWLYFCWKQLRTEGEWVKIDLQQFTWVTKFTYRSYASNYFVTMRFDYSYDDVYYRAVSTGSGLTKFFDTSTAQGGVTNTFYKSILSRYWKGTGIGLGPTQYSCIQFAFYGCKATCRDPLGVENMNIENSWITSDATAYLAAYPPSMGRLNLNFGGFQISTPGMLSIGNFVIDLNKQTIVTGVQIQGCTASNAWVTSFRVQYKLIATDSWSELSDDKGLSPFNGNSDATRVTTSFFNSGAVAARYIQLIPLQYSTSVCWRMELLGCSSIPPYANNLAALRPVTATMNDTAVSPNLPVANAVTPQYLFQNLYHNAAHVPTNIGTPDRAIMTVDLGSPQTITSVEISAPVTSPEYSLIPDGLWLFDILHGGDDASGNGNHAILSNGVSYTTGFDGRPNGALYFDGTNTGNVLIPTRNIGFDNSRGWSGALWIWIDPSFSAAGQNLFSIVGQFTSQGLGWGFLWEIRGTGAWYNDYIQDPTISWGMEKAAGLVPFGRWTFLAFTLDCRGGMVRQFVDNKVQYKRYYGCPPLNAQFSYYSVMNWNAPGFIGKVACFQVYSRALDQNEVEQASLCPWLPPAPFALFPLDCTLNDIQGSSGIVFAPQTANLASCSSYQGIPKKSWALSGTYLTVDKSASGLPALGSQYSFTMLVHVLHTGWNAVMMFTQSGTNYDRLVTSGGGNQYYAKIYCEDGSWFNAWEYTVVRFRYNKWNYVGFTYDYGTSTIGMWFEGEMVQTAVKPGCFTTAPTGNWPIFYLGNSGNIACFQIYHTVLTKRQINSVRRCPWSGINSKFNFPMDNQAGSNLFETWSNSMTVTGAGYTTGFPWAPSGHRTYSITGQNTYLSLNPLPSGYGINGTSAISIAMMANISPSAGGASLLFSMAGPDSAALKLWAQPGSPNKLEATYTCNEGTVDVFSTSAAFTQGIWSHQMISIYPGSSNHFLKLYSDGMEKLYNAPGYNCNLKPTTSLYVGSDTTNWMLGSVSCLAAFPAFLEQRLAQEVAECPTPSRIEGHMCDNDLVPIASMTFSSTYTSAAGVVYNMAIAGSTWSGNSSVAGSTACCWWPSVSNTSQWIQASFTEQKIFSGLEIFGDTTSNNYVSSYKIAYSVDGYSFVNYQDRATSADKVFVGNTYASSTAFVRFRPPIKARFIQLLPLTWNGGIALQWALRGCAELLCNTTLFDSSVKVTFSSATDVVAAYRCQVGSNRDWTTNTTDTTPFYQVTFAQVKVVNTISVQGSYSQAAWITKYHLLYSYDTVNWQAYTFSYNGSRIRIFDGPSSGSNGPVMTVTLKPPVIAQAIRVVVDGYNTQAIARFDFRGCNYADIPSPIPSISVRVGNSTPSTASSADTQAQCGLTVPSSSVPYGSKVTLTCQPPIFGRYISIVSQIPGYDMTISQIAAYSDPGTNFAYLKAVTASSDINVNLTNYLTDGDLTTGSIGSSSTSMWFQVDLGQSFLVSKVVLATKNSGWGAYSTYAWAANTGPNMCQNSGMKTMSCSGGQVIWIQGGYYGQVFRSFCFTGIGSPCTGKTNANLMNYITSNCHLRTNCSVNTASSFWEIQAGDGCFGYLKALDFNYLCVDPLNIAPKLTILVGNDATSANNAVCDFLRLSQSPSYVPGSSFTFHCTPPLTGRYIRIVKKSSMTILFSEILVY